MSTLKLKRRADGWWIVGGPPGVDEMGPYDTKAEADDDRRGVERWLKRNAKWLSASGGPRVAGASETEQFFAARRPQARGRRRAQGRPPEKRLAGPPRLKIAERCQKALPAFP